MAKEGRTKRRYQENLEAVPQCHRALVIELDRLFATMPHNLWDGDAYHVSPLRQEFAEKIRNRHLDDLADDELDHLMFSVISTMGSVQTLKFLLPRFFAAYFSNRDLAGAAEPFVVKGKLEKAGVHEWPAEEKQAALMALIAYDRQHKRLSDLPEEVIDGGDTSAEDWARNLLEDN